MCALISSRVARIIMEFLYEHFIQSLDFAIAFFKRYIPAIAESRVHDY